ncbi:MAG: hypothetical protein A3D44_03010 [Candidatus Staskawiczbacteria bacterium RIFCSPHIGHO2_02_FULL_42_22]|uniref:DegT/DnrJ/EryC1/StrS aminotransferase n=1 Tax=Candidatus Staskawiczbacteria bacterium RIFCSPHIGHO2_02_FULL_42_22 TaxID=1802207 RepID=A0A1G2I4Z4_9BACT|nr:MAG: hypothetical protein A3D44_03010 [Candidatus Staskawiczbacteria bacterium RIFCSPHIGHO2_02_FULL_42_22]
MKNSDVVKSYQAYRSRVARETIPCYEPSIGKEELRLVTDVIKRNWLSENKYTREFESQLAKICQRKYSVAFANATAALICGMKALGIKEGDEVIVPSFSHGADPNSVSNAGATVVFTDVDPVSLCLTRQTIEKAITKKTKAILYVCAYGNVSDLDAMADYAKSKKIFFINDCAPALFGSYKYRPIASYGDFSVLSFFADKTITTGEGGMLLSNNLALMNKVNRYKHDGRRERGVDVIEEKGYNFRITELQTAVGVAQLKKAPYFVKRKKEILRYYIKKLAGINSVRLFTFNPDGDIVPHRVVIFVPNAKNLITYLTSLGIGVRSMFMPMHSMPAYQTKGDLPNTQEIFKTGVCLPSAPSLTDKNIEFICQSIKKFYA